LALADQRGDFRGDGLAGFAGVTVDAARDFFGAGAVIVHGAKGCVGVMKVAGGSRFDRTHV
jgi:hypothetical protein